MTWLAFGFGMVVGALIAATYWATKYWEAMRNVEHQGRATDRARTEARHCNHRIREIIAENSREAKRLVLDNDRLKDALKQTQDVLMERNRIIDAVKESLDPQDPW